MAKFFQDKRVKKTLENKKKELRVKIEKDVLLVITKEATLVTTKEANNYVNA
jgi:heat shock protein HslJ